MPPPETLIIRPLRLDDQLKHLSLGQAEFTALKTFLRKQACQCEQYSLARTHVMVPEEAAQAAGRVWGYVTLVASELDATDPHLPPELKWRYHLPAVKLARMAIDTELQRNGWGRRLCEWAIATVKEHVARHIGCRVFVTDAKKSAVGFYEKMGFTLLNTEANRTSRNPLMFINLTKLVVPEPDEPGEPGVNDNNNNPPGPGA